MCTCVCLFPLKKCGQSAYSSTMANKTINTTEITSLGFVA